MVVDEALAVGDAVFTQKCMRFLRNFMERGTLLFVSHDTAAIKSLCDRVVWIDKGQVMQIGPTKEVCDRYMQACYEAEQGSSAQAPAEVATPKAEAVDVAYHDQRRDFFRSEPLRNDIEVFRFNPDATSFGLGGARITGAWLMDEARRPLHWVVGGEPVVLRVQAQCLQALHAPIVGFVVKDRTGQAVFGDNSYLSTLDAPVACAAGQQLQALELESAQKQWQIDRQSQQMQELARQLSPLWRAKDVLRKVRSAEYRLRQKLGPYEPASVRKVRHALRRRLSPAAGAVAAVQPQAVALAAHGARHYGVMATAHTQFVAHGLARALRAAGFSVTLLQDVPEEGFVLDMYIVICPQMFKVLPPGERRIALQMEQSVSPRWFTAGYLSILGNSLSAWDYAPANLAFLESKGLRYPHTFLVPIGGIVGYSHELQACGEPALQPAQPVCDVLFYGDVNAPRRQDMLQALQRHFSVRIEGNLFGDALRQAVRGARLVVNIHYYEGALLETTRIYECLSLGVPVVTESSADIAAYADWPPAAPCG